MLVRYHEAFVSKFDHTRLDFTVNSSSVFELNLVENGNSQGSVSITSNGEGECFKNLYERGSLVPAADFRVHFVLHVISSNSRDRDVSDVFFLETSL